MSIKAQLESFLIGLQFLSRIHLAKQTVWTEEAFGRSVRYFPLIGSCIGILLGLAAWSLESHFSSHFIALFLLLFNIYLTGGLHCDGFMDTMDGLLSGREPKRILEIMKDSRVGANGVVLFVALFSLKWTFLEEISQPLLPLTLFSAAVLARLAMVLAITRFPYARPEGLGKSFAQYASPKTWWQSFSITVLLFLPLSQAYLIFVFLLMFVLVFAFWFSKRVSDYLGGLTGDIYGCITELTELLVYFLMFILSKWLM